MKNLIFKIAFAACLLGVLAANAVVSNAQTRKPKSAAAVKAAKPRPAPAKTPAPPIPAIVPPTAQPALPAGKKAGVIRIAMATPKVQLAENPEGVDAAAAVRNTFGELMQSKTIEIVTLDSRLAVQIAEEVKEKGIDYLMYTSLTQKKGGGGGMFGGGMFGKMAERVTGNTAARVASRVPGGGGLGGEIARDVAATTLYSVSDMLRTIKISKKDEFTLEYKLLSPDGKTLVGNTTKAKATADGEDIITPLIEGAANAVLTVIIK